MTNAELTEIVAILDRSGSMMLVKTDTEGAFDSYVGDQRTKPGEANLTLVQFDTKIDTMYASRPLAKVPPLQLHLGGMTALYDAIGTTVVRFGARLADLEEDQRPGHVIVLILTDGLENSSKEWTKGALRKLIEEQTTKYGWVFLYLGANQDAVFEGGEIGISADTSLTYDVKNMGATVAMASSASGLVREGNFRGFSQKDRDAAVGKDLTPRPSGDISGASRNQDALKRARRNLSRGTS